MSSVEGPLHFLTAELERLEGEGLLRDPDDPIAALGGARSGLLVLCSNDYLGYASEPWPTEIAEECPGGAGASRLVCGSHPAHGMAERALSTWVGLESALLFSSGFAANLGAISSLAGRGDLIVSDALNHASIIDGCRLSGAEIKVVPHCDSKAVEGALRGSVGARRRWVITESYFSMDGDIPDLVGLRELCDRYGAALVVDEAHALGVFGPSGAGLCAEMNVRPDVLIGTLGKSLGLQGAFVAGAPALRTFLWNRARSFVFSTGISPVLAAATVERVRRAAADHEGRQRLLRSATQLREGLSRMHPSVRRDLRGPIIPWVVGSSSKSLQISRFAREHGLLVQAIRPPTVPAGTARLRVTATACLPDRAIEHALRVFAAVPA